MADEQGPTIRQDPTSETTGDVSAGPELSREEVAALAGEKWFDAAAAVEDIALEFTGNDFASVDALKALRTAREALKKGGIHWAEEARRKHDLKHLGTDGKGRINRPAET